GDQLHRTIARSDFDGRRIVHERIGQLADFVRERRREQQVLALGGKEGEDAAYRRYEPHVEHAIGLVEHEDFDLAQVYGALLDVIEQAPGRRDDEIGRA